MRKPSRKTTTTLQQLHAEMMVWAKTHDKRKLHCALVYEDGTHHLIHSFKRAQRESEYLGHDGEVYTVPIDTALYNPDWLAKKDQPQEVSRHTIRILIRNWLKAHGIHKTTKVSFFSTAIQHDTLVEKLCSKLKVEAHVARELILEAKDND
jgi:nicotinic acid phosphoribosyltransferase